MTRFFPFNIDNCSSSSIVRHYVLRAVCEGSDTNNFLIGNERFYGVFAVQTPLVNHIAQGIIYYCSIVRSASSYRLYLCHSTRNQTFENNWHIGDWIDTNFKWVSFEFLQNKYTKSEIYPHLIKNSSTRGAYQSIWWGNFEFAVPIGAVVYLWDHGSYVLHFVSSHQHRTKWKSKSIHIYIW